MSRRRLRDRLGNWSAGSVSPAQIAKADWAHTARTLSYRDRWALYRAALRGRAVAERRLAAPAVERAEAGLLQFSPGWLWWAQLALAGAFLLLGAAALVSGRWFAIGQLGLGLLMLSTRTQFGWSRRLAERGAAANRQLLDTPPVRDSGGPAEPR